MNKNWIPLVLFSLAYNLVCAHIGNCTDTPNGPPKGPRLKGGLNLVGATKPTHSIPTFYGDLWAEGTLAVMGNLGVDPSQNPPTAVGGAELFDISGTGAPKWLKTWSPISDCNSNCQSGMDLSPAGTIAQQTDFADVVIKNKIGYFASNSGLGIYIVDLRNFSQTNLATPVLYHITDTHPVLPADPNDDVPTHNFPNIGVHDIRVETVNGHTYLFAVGIQDP